MERKAKLRKLIPRKPSSVLYLDHINDKGVELFEQCCKLDLEGVVAKPKLSPYRELGGKVVNKRVAHKLWTGCGSTISSWGSHALSDLWRSHWEFSG